MRQTWVRSPFTDNVASVVANIIILACKILGDIFDFYVEFECLLLGVIAAIPR